MKHRLRAALIAFAVLFAGATPCAAQSVDEGVALFNARKFGEARAALLPFGERDAVAAFHLGRLLMEENDEGRAAEWFEKAVKLDAKNAVYYDWLGRSYGRQAQRASKLKVLSLARKTRNAWETALALDPNNLDVRDNLIAYYLQAPGFVGGSKEKARQMVTEIRRRNAYRGSIAAANLCAAEKDDPCVERELTGLMTGYPDSGSVFVSAAALYTNRQQFDKSFALLEARLRERPGELAIHYQIGRTAAVSGQNLDRGEEALKRYIASPPERGPAPANAHYRLGMIYDKKGSKDLARKEYQTAIQLNPKYEDAKKALAGLGR